MRKNILPSVLALLGGAVGFGLRKWQLRTGFEPDTGLAVPGAPAGMVLIVCSALVALALLLLCRKGEKRLSWEQAFAEGLQNTVFVTAALLSAILLLASAGAEVVANSVKAVNTYAGETQIARLASAALPPLRILLCLGALPCVFLWARALFRGEGVNENPAPLEPCLLYCVWLISDYQLRSSDPVVMDYLYEVLAIVFSLLGLYFIAGYAFSNGKPRRTLFCCLMGTYFSLVTLADAHSLADMLRYGFGVLFLTAHALLIQNCPPVEQSPAEAETEADDHA